MDRSHSQKRRPVSHADFRGQVLTKQDDEAPLILTASQLPSLCLYLPSTNHRRPRVQRQQLDQKSLCESIGPYIASWQSMRSLSS